MSDFLNNLAARSLGLADAVQPRIRSLFEPQDAQVNQPGRFSVHLSPESLDAREEEPVRRTGLGISDSSAPTLDQSTRSNPITSSFKPPADSAATQTGDRDAAYHRVEPARARGSTSTVSIPLKEALDLSRPPAPDARVARTAAADLPRLLTTKADPAPQIRDERESRAMLVPDIRRMVDEKITPLEAQRPPGVTRAEQAPASQPATASAARTIMPAQAERAPKLPVAHLRSPAPVVPASPEIKITIGRVDVRAVMPAQPAARSQPPARFAPMSLDDYLRERDGGRR